MKVALIADLHMGVRKSAIEFLNSQLSFFKEQMIPELKEKEIDTLIVLGDVFDTRQAVNVSTQNIVLDLFQNTFKDFNVHIICGNHDIYHTTTTSVNSLKPLALLPNVSVYEEPSEVMFGNQSVLMLPWITNYKTFTNSIDTQKKQKFVFAHLDICGFNMGGALCTDGMTINDLMKKYDYVYTGHFHCRTRKDYADGKAITYIGSPYHITRIDIGQNRGYTILDLDSGDYEFIDNNKSIKFKKFLYPNVPETIEEIKGNIIDVIIPNELSSDTKRIFDLTKRLELLEPAYPVKIEVLNAESNTENIEIDIESMNLESMFKSYTDQMDDETDEMKTKIYNKLIELYNIYKSADK